MKTECNIQPAPPALASAPCSSPAACHSRRPSWAAPADITCRGAVARAPPAPHNSSSSCWVGRRLYRFFRVTRCCENLSSGENRAGCAEICAAAKCQVERSIAHGDGGRARHYRGLALRVLLLERVAALAVLAHVVVQVHSARIRQSLSRLERPRPRAPIFLFFASAEAKNAFRIGSSSCS